MRWIGLAIIFLSIPVLIAFLGRDVRRRDMLIMAAGALMFFTGPLQITASLVAWPMWQGVSKGIILSLLDSIAIALLVTRRRTGPRAPFLPLILLFAVPVTMSVAVAAVKEAAFFVVVQIVQMTVFYIALAGELQRTSALRNLFKGLSIGLMVQAGYVINQKLHGVVQAPGTTAHQNILGIMVELSVLPLVGAILEGQKDRILYFGVLAGLIIIAGGGSRGTMMFFALGLVLVLMISLARRSTPRKWQALGLGVIAALLTMPIAAATLKERFGDTSVTTEEGQRAALARSAEMMAKDHPLGVGANNFVSVSNTQGYAARAGVTWFGGTRSKPAHNAYLVARAETGLAGEVALIVLFGGIAIGGIATAFRMRRAPYVGLAVGSTGAVIAVSFHSLYEYAWYLPDTQRLFFMNMAIIAGCMALARRLSLERRKKIRSARNSSGIPPAAEAAE